MSRAVRPADVCRGLLDALDASEGRRRRRKRDTRPDVIGLDIKRALLERVVREDPPAAEFDLWLARCALEHGIADGPVRAMALDILQDWRLAAAAAQFGGWLESGAPSADRHDEHPLAKTEPG
jgi:hypothetical protein